MKNNKINIILLVLLIIIVISLLVVLNKKDKENNNIKEDVKVYELVNDYSEFYTIEGCANKYYTYLSLGDKETLNKLLFGSYDLDSLISKYKGKNINIKVNEMYCLDNSYYLKGYIYEEVLNGLNKLEEEYLNIKLDKDREYFNIIIIDKEEYERVTSGE